MDQPVPIVKGPLFLHSPFAFVLTMARLKPIIRITKQTQHQYEYAERHQFLINGCIAIP